MATRRQNARYMRRTAHAAMRRQGVIRQEWQSSQEGPSDSPKAQKAVKAQKARRA